jgi:hypothetical protein
MNSSIAVLHLSETPTATLLPLRTTFVRGILGSKRTLWNEARQEVIRGLT